MSSDKRFILSKIPGGFGVALDVGGGAGTLCAALQERGYAYVNVDLHAPRGVRAVKADAASLPFASNSVSVVASSDSLEHFADPANVLREVRRVLAPTGRFVVWVPFMHPFHGDDLFRFTPLGLEALFGTAGLHIDSLEAPLWIFSILGQMLAAALQLTGRNRGEVAIERTAAWVDARTTSWRRRGLAFAAAYLVVARTERQVDDSD